MIGPDKPRLAVGPALLAAAILSAGAIGGLGWSLGRASAGRGDATPAPAVEPKTASRPGVVTRRTPLVKPVPVDEPGPAATEHSAPAAPVDGPATATTPVEHPAEKPADTAAEQPVSARPARVNLNTATAAELELLPGIGPSLAQRIIEHRTKAGRFRTVAELDKVKGIGPRTIEKLRPLVAVE